MQENAGEIMITLNKISLQSIMRNDQSDSVPGSSEKYVILS